MMDFGFTNDLSRLEAARAYRDAAVADGWHIEPAYRSEPVERASKLRRDGYVMSILTRENAGSWKAEASIHIWGPDGLVIKPPDEYDWQAIQGGLRTCNECGAKDVDTERYSFAGRCCTACLPAMRAEHEKPGWCN